MTDTRFAVGDMTAYLTDQVIAVGLTSGVEGDLMTLCASGDWAALTNALLAGRVAAAVMHRDDRVRIIVTGQAAVEVTMRDGVRRFEGAGSPTATVVDGAFQVTVLADAGGGRPAAEYRTDGGAVPASVVSRRVGGPGETPDPFESMFGHTVSRPIEDAALRPVELVPRRSTLGVLVFSTGERVDVDTEVVLGRNPRATDATTTRPRLVRLPYSGVSRRHALIRPDRWRISIDDLGSANGTWVTTSDRSSVRVVPGAPTELAAGAVVDLGRDVSFTVQAAA